MKLYFSIKKYREDKSSLSDATSQTLHGTTLSQ